MQTDSIIESIKDYISQCPLVDEEYRVNVDYLSEKMSYSVDPLPSNPIIAKYTDGGAKKQFQFALTSKEEYDEDARITIENSGFFQEFEEWLEANALDGKLPILSNGKHNPYWIETLNSGFLFDTEGVTALYRIECRLLYTQEV